MQKFYKYEYGYININSDNLYFTNSGNWSETKELTEKTLGSSLKNGVRKTRMIVFIVASAILLGAILLKNLSSGNISILLLILAPLGIYQVYKTLITETGPRFMIPLKKIENIEVMKNGINITFRNIKNELDSEFVENIKGFELEIILELIKGKKLNISENVN